MKILITENNLKTAIFKYFDMMKGKGKEPFISKNLHRLFKTDKDTLFSYLIEYLGGETKAVELTRSKLEELPDRIKLEDAQFNGELYFNIVQVAREIPEYEDYLPVEAEVYGEVHGVDVWNDENDEYDYVESMSLSDYYGQEDMTGSWEIRDIFSSDINGYLHDKISLYTGIYVSVESLSFTDG